MALFLELFLGKIISVELFNLKLPEFFSWNSLNLELNLEQSMDVIGQHLDLLDAHWLTFGTLNREDCAAST